MVQPCWHEELGKSFGPREEACCDLEDCAQGSGIYCRIDRPLKKNRQTTLGHRIGLYMSWIGLYMSWMGLNMSWMGLDLVGSLSMS